MQWNLPDFSKSRALVIGDLMLDRYWYGGTQRISPEAPVPVVNVNHMDERPGGAGNVALNLVALGMQVHLYGCVGQDESGEILDAALTRAGISHHLVKESEHPTIAKLRILSQNQQLLRLDFEQKFNGISDLAQLPDFQEVFMQSDIVILSDYNKGTLPDPQLFIEAARALNKPIIVDPKGDDFKKYFGATLLTPNQKEFELIVGPCPSTVLIEERGHQLLKEQGLDALLITRGSKGMTLLQASGQCDHYPAQAKEVYDVTGAGDTVISVLAAMMASGESLPHATATANLAASIVVSRLGAATVTPQELRRLLRKHYLMPDKIIDWKQVQRLAGSDTTLIVNDHGDAVTGSLLERLEQAKQSGKRVIVVLQEHDDSLLTAAERQFFYSSLNCVDGVCIAQACLDPVI